MLIGQKINPIPLISDVFESHFISNKDTIMKESCTSKLKPQLDIRISTGWGSSYASRIEDFFSRHLENMIMRRHVVPEFKVRYAPFFSGEYFNFKTPSDNCFDLHTTSMLSCTV